MALAYKGLIDKYPKTEYADFARKKLGQKVAKTPAPAPQPQTQTTTPADTSDTTKAPKPPEIPRAPQPVNKGAFNYPESQIESGIKGKVVLKIIIDYTGKVTEAVILNSLNNAEIDEAAKNAALNTTFNQQLIDPLNLGKWFLYEIDVNPPPQSQKPD